MAKSKKQPHVQLLSPENYIRQKARNLPIYECRINDNWKEMGSAEIVIARTHANGNITLGMYMVDLYCLGVRDTHYRFNTTIDDYEELLELLANNFEMKEIDYTLVHNIIFAANEYAAELGFKPHKDFTSVSQYLLEEDTDEIELIEIECGRNGKPLFIQTDFVTDAEGKRIINQLEKAVGKGNFDVIFSEDGDEMDFDDDLDEDWEQEDDFEAMKYDEKIDLFRMLTANGLDDISDVDKNRLKALTDSIYALDICDDDEVDYFCNQWIVEADMIISEEFYTAELLSQEPRWTITGEEEIELDEIAVLMNETPQKVEKYLIELKKKWGNIPYLNYKELKYIELNKPKEYEKKFRDYYAQFSQFPLFKLEEHKYKLINSVKIDDLNLIKFEDVFIGRNAITEVEMFEFQMTKLLTLIARGKMNEIEAMYISIDNLDLKDEFYVYLDTMLVLTRINLLEKYLDSHN